MRALIILDIITVTPVSRSSLVDPVRIFTFIYFFTVHDVTLSRTAFDFYTRSTSTQTSIYRKWHQESGVFFAEIRTAFSFLAILDRRFVGGFVRTSLYFHVGKDRDVLEIKVDISDVVLGNR